MGLVATTAGCGSDVVTDPDKAPRPAPLAQARLLISIAGDTGPAYRVSGDGSRRRIKQNVGTMRRSPDGQYIAHLEPTGQHVRGYPVQRLVSSRPDGHEREVFAAPRGREAPYSIDAYDWAPDGQRLAVAMSDFGSETFAGNPVPGRLVIARRDGSAQRTLQKCETGNGPAWSPDGSLIAFSCRFEPVTLLRTHGRPRRVQAFGAKVPLSAGVAPISWRPDGRQLAYRTSTGFTQNYDYTTTLISANGTTSRGPRNATAFSWSPDGTYYAYSTGDPADPAPHRLVLVNASTNKPLRTISVKHASVIDWYR